MHTRFKLQFTLLFCLLSPALTPTTASADDPLHQLINDRLGLMREVAAYKWHEQRAIEDLARENLVINAAVTSGLQHGLTIESSAAFFQAQITAAKDIQQCWFDRWQSGHPASTFRDLNDAVRPQLISLGSQITARLGASNNKQPGDDFPVECLSEESKQQLQLALESIRFYPNRLTQIQKSKRLRIGTTGDYRPFSLTASFSSEDINYTGIDIDMARDLAKSLGVEPEFVLTSWPTLSEDLIEGRYDIAMSGVSITGSRENIGYFSIAYQVGGKSPITLCEHSKSFNALQKIDQPGVRIIVNPGGTNERFIDNNIQAATKILHDDNRTIFKRITSGHADVMITDLIEVQLQSSLNPQLCSSMDTTLTYQEKGYWMPKDDALQEAVNRWLMQSKKEGLVEAVFQKHLH